MGVPTYDEKHNSDSDDATNVERGTAPYSGYGSATDKALVWKQDLRIVPLCAAIYLLCYLDRSNIGNAKVLNAEDHDDLLSETAMTNYQYIIALMLFLIAYALFEVRSGTSEVSKMCVDAHVVSTRSLAITCSSV